MDETDGRPAEGEERPGPRSREELIEFFDRFGYVTLCGLEEYDPFMAFLAKNNIPTWTTNDPETATVTVHRRPWGAIEGWFPGI